MNTAAVLLPQDIFHLLVGKKQYNMPPLQNPHHCDYFWVENSVHAKYQHYFLCITSKLSWFES